jgi:hypothetical protein
MTDLVCSSKIRPWGDAGLVDFDELEAPDLFTYSITTMCPPNLYIGRSSSNEAIVAWPYHFYCNRCKGRIILYMPTVFSKGSRAPKRVDPSHHIECPRCEAVASEYCDFEWDRN